METPVLYEGTWEEVAAHAPELAGRRVRLEVIEDPVTAERLARLRRGLAMVEEASRGLGPFPDRKLTLDVLYPNEDEPR